MHQVKIFLFVFFHLLEFWRCCQTIKYEQRIVFACVGRRLRSSREFENAAIHHHTHTHITHTSLPGHSPGSAITTVHTQHTRTNTLAQHLRTHTHTHISTTLTHTQTHTHISTTPTHSSRPLTSVSTKKHRRKEKNNTGAQYSALAIILLKIGYKLTFMPRNCIVYIYA